MPFRKITSVRDVFCCCFVGFFVCLFLWLLLLLFFFFFFFFWGGVVACLVGCLFVLFLFVLLIDNGSVEELELFDNVVLRCVDRRYFRRGDCVVFVQSTM